MTNTISKKITFLLLSVAAIISSCSHSSSQQDMVNILKAEYKRNYVKSNPFCPEASMAGFDSLFKKGEGKDNVSVLSIAAGVAIKAGREQQAVSLYESVINKLDTSARKSLLPELGLAYMRLGERTNCMLNHNGSSCIFPIKNEGVHKLQTGSRNAIKVYQEILNKNPGDMESRWLLNIAYMTLGEYPKGVPAKFLVPGLDADTGYKVKPFTDVAPDLGLNINGRAGGVIVDDFNNDGYLDIVTSGWELDDHMHYFQNNKDGTFSDLTKQSGLTEITGGLNIEQTDYNNDGNTDIFVLRGAWHTNGFGDQPSSLLRNNGDGTFTDVTTESGLLSYSPTQTAVWADFNNDGWLDVFMGAEHSGDSDTSSTHICALYVNNHDGTFTNVTTQANCNITGYVKGVTAADYNNDGWPDLFVSTLGGEKYLLKNKGKPGQVPEFENVTAASGIGKNTVGSFATWFYDYNNDGKPDLLICGYSYSKSLGQYAAAEALGMPTKDAGYTYLYRNNGDGTFTDVTTEAGLNKVVFAMGCNFGDIDNDGYPDMYFGTGNPDFKSLIPNKLFKNIGGKRFADVTTSSRTGNLQKGHGVAFADFRNNGMQDIYIEMGGAFKGDSYTSSLYLNPGQTNNNWISLKLEGVDANKTAIGSRIKVSFTENGMKRSVYKDVNSGGSFGSSPLRQEIGIGQAKTIDEVEIRWAGSNKIQRFKNIAPNQFLKITEGDNKPVPINLAKLTFKRKLNTPMSMPMTAGLMGQ